MPPTHEWGVETGISRRHAVTSQMPTEKMTQKQPYMRSGGLSRKASSSAMPLRMVFTTSPPRKVAPMNSMTTAMAHAWRMVSAFEPTDVAKALATSLAPMPKAAKKAERPPRTTSHT